MFESGDLSKKMAIPPPPSFLAEQLIVFPLPLEPPFFKVFFREVFSPSLVSTEVLGESYLTEEV